MNARRNLGACDVLAHRGHEYRLRCQRIALWCWLLGCVSRGCLDLTLLRLRNRYGPGRAFGFGILRDRLRTNFFALPLMYADVALGCDRLRRLRYRLPPLRLCVLL